MKINSPVVLLKKGIFASFNQVEMQQYYRARRTKSDCPWSLSCICIVLWILSITSSISLSFGTINKLKYKNVEIKISRNQNNKGLEWNSSLPVTAANMPDMVQAKIMENLDETVNLKKNK